MFQLAVLGVAAGAFGFMGVAAIMAPARITAQFGVPSLDRDGRNEVRAVYGGFGVAVATGLLLAILRPELRGPVAAATAVALAGMASGRGVSAILDRGIGRFPALYGGLELIGALALFAAAGR